MPFALCELWLTFQTECIDHFWYLYSFEGISLNEWGVRVNEMDFSLYHSVTSDQHFQSLPLSFL
jgi:hypothetical protein